MPGLRRAMVHDCTYVLHVDCDFGHHPHHMPALLAGMARHDMMIGSRYIAGGGVSGWGRMADGTGWAGILEKAGTNEPAAKRSGSGSVRTGERAGEAFVV
jgi:hypothetical protein